MKKKRKRKIYCTANIPELANLTIGQVLPDQGREGIPCYSVYNWATGKFEAKEEGETE